jgi:hypothetical protein
MKIAYVVQYDVNPYGTPWDGTLQYSSFAALDVNFIRHTPSTRGIYKKSVSNHWLTGGKGDYLTRFKLEIKYE